MFCFLLKKMMLIAKIAGKLFEGLIDIGIDVFYEWYKAVTDEIAGIILVEIGRIEAKFDLVFLVISKNVGFFGV